MTKLTTTCEIAVFFHCSLQMCQTWLQPFLKPQFWLSVIAWQLWFTKSTVTHEMVLSSLSFFTGHNLPVLCLTASLDLNCDGPASTYNHSSSPQHMWSFISSSSQSSALHPQHQCLIFCEFSIEVNLITFASRRCWLWYWLWCWLWCLLWCLLWCWLWRFSGMISSRWSKWDVWPSQRHRGL